MLLIASAKGFELTPILKGFTEEVMAKLEPLVQEDTVLRVTLSKEKKDVTAHGHIVVNGENINVYETDEDGYDAILKLSHQLFNMIKKSQAKAKDKAMKQHIDMEVPDPSDDEAVIVKRKQFQMKPMFEEEALMQMNLLDHDFFFFFNADTDTMCLLYRRNDGDYGLIEGI